MPPARKRVLLRVRDVGIALLCAHEYKRALGKVQLQKFVYLLDALNILFLSLPIKKGFETYKRGPWDQVIQHAVDSLVFQGLATAGARVLEIDEVAVQYQLSAPGITFAERLSQQDGLRVRFRVGQLIAAQVESRGWHRLKKFVYAEPHYVAMRNSGFGRSLAPADGFGISSRSLIHLIRESLEAGWENFDASEESVTEAFFEFLEAYQRPTQKVGYLWT